MVGKAAQAIQNASPQAKKNAAKVATGGAVGGSEVASGGEVSRQSVKALNTGATEVANAAVGAAPVAPELAGQLAGAAFLIVVTMLVAILVAKFVTL